MMSRVSRVPGSLWSRVTRFWALGALLLVVSGCQKPKPLPKVVNPMIDSAEKFVVVYAETVARPRSGLDIFLDMLRPSDSAREGESLPVEPARARQGMTSRGEPPVPAVRVRTSVPKPDTAEPVHDPGTIELTGTVHHVGLEGGFWAITGDNGQKYDPLNLPEDLQQAGLRVRLWVRIRKDIATTHMWGTPVQVVSYVVPQPAPPDR